MNKERPLVLIGCGGCGIVLGVMGLAAAIFLLVSLGGPMAKDPKFLTEIGGEHRLQPMRGYAIVGILIYSLLLLGSIFSLMLKPIGPVFMRFFGVVAVLLGIVGIGEVFMAVEDPYQVGAAIAPATMLIFAGLLAFHVFSRDEVKACFVKRLQ